MSRCSSSGLSPQVGRFRLEGDRLVREEVIVLKDEHGVPLPGLPPAAGGSTGEIPKTWMAAYSPTTLIDRGRTIAVSNDDDFGVTDDGNGHLLQKLLPSGVIDHNEVWFFRLSRSLTEKQR